MAGKSGSLTHKRGRDGKMWQTGRIGKIGRPNRGSVNKTIAVRQKVGRQHRFVAEKREKAGR